MRIKSHRDSSSEATSPAISVSTEDRNVAAKVPSQWSVLRNRNFALFFWGELLSSTGTQMQVVEVKTGSSQVN